MPTENIATDPPLASIATGCQRCFSSLGCPELTLEEIAALAAEFEVGTLELRSMAGRTDMPALLADAPGGWEGAKEFLRGKRLKSQVLGTSFKMVGHTEALWKELLEFAALAEALETPYVRAFGGGAWGAPLTSDDYRQAAAAMERWNEERHSRGWQVQLLVETHDAFSASEPCVRLLEQTPVELIWDTHHTWRLGGESPEESWSRLGEHVRHVHIKDSVLIPSARHPYTYVLPGEGEMPLREVLDLLARNGFQGAISLEWEKMWHPYLAPLSDALRACRRLGW